MTLAWRSPYWRGRLAESIDTAEKPAEMARQSHEQYGDRFDRQAVIWQGFLWMAPRAPVDPQHKRDQCTRCATLNEVHQQNPFELLSLERPLPRGKPGRND